jgi:REP element-mobilizing transposase RayT
MNLSRPAETRKSFMSIGELYFFTATIHKWQHLLARDDFKQVIIESLRYLCENNLLRVYGFVIMPNHIHLLWQTLGMNGRESVQAAFLKYTAHRFRRLLLAEGGFHRLRPYAVDASNKDHEFWQRDSLAVWLYSRDVAFQKLYYVHRNPMAKHWALCTSPDDYRYSSAKYYETGEDEFGFLSDLNDCFGQGMRMR